MSSDNIEKPSKAFYELCYDQYKIELEEAEKLYQKISILLVLIPVAGSISVSLGRTDLVVKMFERVDIFLFHTSFLAAWFMLAIGTAFSLLCVIPRTYKRIGDMEGWRDWKNKYQKYIEDSNNKEDIEEALIRDICPKLADAQTKNAPINEKRRKYFQKAVLFASISLIPLALQAISYFLLKLQGI